MFPQAARTRDHATFPPNIEGKTLPLEKNVDGDITIELLNGHSAIYNSMVQSTFPSATSQNVSAMGL